MQNLFEGYRIIWECLQTQFPLLCSAGAVRPSTVFMVFGGVVLLILTAFVWCNREEAVYPRRRRRLWYR